MYIVHSVDGILEVFIGLRLLRSIHHQQESGQPSYIPFLVIIHLVSCIFNLMDIKNADSSKMDLAAQKLIKY